MEDTISTAGATVDDQNATDQSTTTATDTQNVNQDANLDTSTSTDNTSDATASDKTSTDDAKSDDSDKNSDTDNSSTTFDSDLDDWAERTNRPKPTNDRERELYQEIRNTARDMGRQKQAKEALGNVGDAIRDTNPTTQTDSDDSLELEDTVSALQKSIQEERSLRIRSEYVSANEVSTDEARVMGEILKEKVDRAPQNKKQAIYDFWTDPDNMADWHQLAKSKLSQSTSPDDKLAEEVKRQERARIAKESQAAGTSRSAKSTVTEGEKTDDQRRLELWESLK